MKDIAPLAESFHRGRSSGCHMGKYSGSSSPPVPSCSSRPTSRCTFRERVWDALTSPKLGWAHPSAQRFAEAAVDGVDDTAG